MKTILPMLLSELKECDGKVMKSSDEWERLRHCENVIKISLLGKKGDQCEIIYTDGDRRSSIFVYLNN